jgi:dTDP-4-dehydrorhamnose reductase
LNMKLLILGAAGMLGHRMCRLLADRFEVWGTFHDNAKSYARFNLLPNERVIDGVNAQDIASVRMAVGKAKPDAVINCIGIVKQRNEAKQSIPSIYVNALFPHQLADLCEENGARVFQISTDCVFSGSRGKYMETDAPDPVDLYGRTKLLGELNRSNCLTLRTSIVGWQINTYSNLLGWFALQRGNRIQGYHRAIYSGLSTSVLVQLIGDLVATRPDLHGLYQVASEPISKYELLVKMRDILGWKDITSRRPQAGFRPVGIRCLKAWLRSGESMPQSTQKARLGLALSRIEVSYALIHY